MGGTYNFRSAITIHNNVLFKYPVKPRKYWETLLYKDLLNNLSCYLSCLCASVSLTISAFGRKYFCLPGRKYFCLSRSKFYFYSKANVFSSDEGDTNISATMFLTFDKGFSLKKNI